MFNRLNPTHFRFLSILFLLTFSFALATDEQPEKPKWKELLDRADSLWKANEQNSAIIVGKQALELAEKVVGKEDSVLFSIFLKLGLFNEITSRFAAAESLFQSALNIQEEKRSPVHKDLVIALINLGNVYNDQSKFLQSESLFQRAVSICTELHETEIVNLAHSYNGLANAYYYQGKYEKAEPLYRHATEIYKKSLGPLSPALAGCLKNLGSILKLQNKYAEAENLFMRSLSIREKTLGHEHPEVARSLKSLASLFHEKAEYDRAEPLLLRALTIIENEFGKEHFEVATILDELAGLYLQQGKKVEARPLLLRALIIMEKTLGPEHPAVAKSLNKLAGLCWNQGKYAEAESLSLRALNIVVKTLGPEHPAVAESLNKLAGFCWNQGKYAEAESLSLRALNIVVKTLGPEHPAVAESLNKLAGFYFDQGKYLRVEPLLMRAVFIQEKTLGPEHPAVAGSLDNFANLYMELGKYMEAEPLLLRALIIMEKTLGPEHPAVAKSLNSLSLLYWVQGKYAEAESLSQRALAIQEKNHGSEHPEVAGCLTNLAILYMEQEKYTEAEQPLQRALTIREKAFGPEHRIVAESLNNLAVLYRYQRKYSECEALHQRALAIRKIALWPGHKDMAYSLNNLAILYRHQGKYTVAEPLFERALDIKINALGPEHPAVAETREEISKLRRLQRKMSNASEECNQGLRIRESHFQLNARALSEKDAFHFAKKLIRSRNTCFSSCFDSDTPTPSLIGEIAVIAFNSKGQVTDMVHNRRRRLFAESDSVTFVLAESLRLNQFLLSKLYVSGPEEDDTTSQYKHKLDSLSALTKQLESDLARKSASFAKFKSSQDIRVERIDSLMPENSVLLEYLKYDYLQLNPDTNIPHYLVVTLGKNETPDILDLGEARPIDSLITQYKAQQVKISEQRHPPTRDQKSEYQELAQKLYDATVRPIEKHLAGKELVIVAPDGALNLVSFAGLIDGDGKYLIEKYPIHYLSAGRDLIRLSEPEESGQNLLAIGDPDYNATVASRLGKSDSALYASVNPESFYTTRNVRSGCGDLRDLQVTPLPYTRKEVEAVVQHWNAHKKEKAATFFGPQASEENFKAESSGKRIIHLATHGYFLEGNCNPEQKAARFGEETKFIGENPLLLSGLLFAGANLHGQGADSVDAEDGILSAYEVSAMNLHGADMVVLSACETGLGEVKEGEGVYGLRRAFQLAGARTVVSALWPVSDKETASMMSELYTESNETLPQKMRRIQLDRIAKLRQGGFADHPFTWGAFIAMGDWR